MYMLTGFRITPAGAGKTAFGYVPQAAARDHPRRCGENQARREPRQSAPGSPPQVRGKPSYGLQGDKRSGITPAGAGKTPISNSFHAFTKDHPRRCGENVFARHSGISGVGSPPQVRGKPAMPELKAAKSRITPRRCGENAILRRSIGATRGSPPQVRGKHARSFASTSADGITPAGAGKTPLSKSKA